jgi:hypothetical protein
MAHYAFLDDNNTVTEVITGVDETELIEGLSPEEWYGNFRGQKCIRTSYNGNIRKNFAGIGMKYDESFDVFIPSKPFPSWKFNFQTAKWEPLVEKLEDGEDYRWVWSETLLDWAKMPFPA